MVASVILKIEKKNIYKLKKIEIIRKNITRNFRSTTLIPTNAPQIPLSST
jgi:hypothetical protein